MPIDDVSTGGAVLLVFGAGGHGRVVADAAVASGRWSMVVASDRDPGRCAGELLAGVAMQSLDVAVVAEGPLHVAIGDNTARERESGVLGQHRLVTVVHPRAILSAHAEIAGGCFVAAQAVLAPGACLGRGVVVNHGAVVDHDVTVGAFSHIAPTAVLGGGAQLGERVLVGSGAVVQAGRRVANDVTIGAGAVVCVDIVEAGTYVGIPARRIR